MSMETQVFLKSRQKFQMDSFTAQTFFRKPKGRNLFRRFSKVTLHRLNTIRLRASGEPRVSAGSTSSEQAKSQRLQRFRHISYRSAPALEVSLTLIQEV